MNLYSEIFSIIYFIQFAILNCEKLSIEPKINRTFLNIPFHRCYKYGVYFENFYRTVAKASDFSRNNESIEVSTFYNPALLGNKGPEEMGQISYVYLQYNDISENIYNDFGGVGILNYTAWNPIFRQNYGPLEYYYNNSISLGKNLYPLLNYDITRELAEMRFEYSSKTVLTSALQQIKYKWPRATWGFFDYPKCNLLSIDNEDISIGCDKDVMDDNDRLSWLWDFRIALYPCLSIPTYLTRRGKQHYVNARLNEAKRIAEKYDPPLIIIPIVSLTNQDDPDRFLSFVELYFVVEEIMRMNVSYNVMFWTPDRNFNSREQCQSFADRLDNDLATIIAYILNNVED